jgi:hypothetical protein
MQKLKIDWLFFAKALAGGAPKTARYVHMYNILQINTINGLKIALPAC